MYQKFHPLYKKFRIYSNIDLSYYFNVSPLITTSIKVYLNCIESSIIRFYDPENEWFMTNIGFILHFTPFQSWGSITIHISYPGNRGFKNNLFSPLPVEVQLEKFGNVQGVKRRTRTNFIGRNQTNWFHRRRSWWCYGTDGYRLVYWFQYTQHIGN